MKLIRIFFAAVCITPQLLLAQSGYKMQHVPVQSRWAKEVSPANALVAYPRPQMVRSNWHNLNGLWDYAITKKDETQPAVFESKILVPYPIESALSGVKKTLLPSQNLWYRTTFTQPAAGGKTLLHFGAVDWQCTVFVNGKKAGEHTGGYTEFTFDITGPLKPGANEIVVKVYDPSDQGIGPHGKQVLNPKDIYYTPSSGIWQTVWLENVPVTYIAGLRMTPDIDKGLLNLVVDLDNAATSTYVEAIAMANGKQVASWHGEGTSASLVLDKSSLKLWSPATPFLYDLIIRVKQDGKVIDEVRSYFGMRKISIAKDAKGIERICLNNKPYYNLGVLDQGFWPDGLYTAPTDEALAFDIKAIKAMGFNTIRKHIKVEPARWYYHADKLGMLVWQDMVNPNQGLPEDSKPQFEKESAEILAQLHNNPSITTWVLFNEKWGQYDQKRLTEWIKQTDPSRIVNGHTGEILYVNEILRSPSPDAYVSADMTDVHSYPNPMMPIKIPGKAQVLGEFGGIGVFVPNHQWNTSSAWGYIQEKPASLLGKYRIMVQHLKLLEAQGLGGSIYTQPFDVEGEQNGLMTYDREVVKMPFAELKKIHSILNPAMGVLPVVTAINADLTDPAWNYSNLLDAYVEGDRNPAFLKKLAMTASQVGDKTGAGLATADYIATLKKPYHGDDLLYIMQVTSSAKDAGFAIIQNNVAEIDKLMGQRQAEVKMMNIIYKEELYAALSSISTQPNWQQLRGKVAPYGIYGEEIFLRSKFLYYVNRQDWQNGVPAGSDYINKYGDNISSMELNQWAWAVFEKMSEPDLLLEAAKWSKLSVKYNEDASMLDTQANLLYKAGKKEEGIALQERAVNLSGNAELKATLDKMKANK